ncbi:uncharacterized protein JCM10292_007423 [Rhodotorula paludigena]|uniref:uncharacterized protein n=1 Tax=Rhodotorula paludigena TaxID=86838 RepID=UPI00317D7CC3
MPRPPLASAASEPSTSLGAPVSSSIAPPASSSTPGSAVSTGNGSDTVSQGTTTARPALPNSTVSSPSIALSQSPSAAGVPSSRSGESAGAAEEPQGPSNAERRAFLALDGIYDALPVAESQSAASRVADASDSTLPTMPGNGGMGLSGAQLEGPAASQSPDEGHAQWVAAHSALGMTFEGVPLIPLAPDYVRSDASRRTGRCKFFNAQKGFGFILDDNAAELNNDEVFVHYTAIAAVQGGPRGFRSLLEVEYTIAQGPKGWQAQDVTGPNGAPCIGTPPGGVPKAQLPLGPASPDTRRRPILDVKTGVRRASGQSSAFTSPMRSRANSGLFGSNPNSSMNSSRTSHSSPASRSTHLHGLNTSPQTYQPVFFYSHDQLGQNPQLLGNPYPGMFPPPGEGGEPGRGPAAAVTPIHPAFFAPRDDGAALISPVDPRYSGQIPSHLPLPQPGIDPSGAPLPYYPISSSDPATSAVPMPIYPPHPSQLGASPGAYPISSHSPSAPPFMPLYPGVPHADGSMPIPMPYGTAAPPHMQAAAYIVDPATGYPVPSAPYHITGAPPQAASGLAAGWADGEPPFTPQTYFSEDGQALPTAPVHHAMPTKVGPPVPGSNVPPQESS